MRNRLAVLIVLLLLMAVSMAAYSHANLTHRSTAITITVDESLLALECNTPTTYMDLPLAHNVCQNGAGKVDLYLNPAAWQAAGHIAPGTRRIGSEQVSAYEPYYTLQIRNRSKQTIQVDVDVSEEWPSWAGICTFDEDENGEHWFIKPGSGDTGYTHPLGPLATMELSFEFSAPFPGSAGFASDHFPVADIKASVDR